MAIFSDVYADLSSRLTIVLLSLMSLLSSLLLVSVSAHADTTYNPWQDLAKQRALADNSLRSAQVVNRAVVASAERLLTLSPERVKQRLNQHSVNTPMIVPLPNGQTATYHFTYQPVMVPELAAKYPEIATFTAVDANNPANHGSFDLTPQGFHGMFTHEGKRIMIDPTLVGNTTHYSNYFAKDAIQQQPRKPDVFLKRVSQHHTHSQDHHSHSPSHNHNHNHDSASQLSPKPSRSQPMAKPVFTAKRPLAGSQLTTYRIAITTTGDYTAKVHSELFKTNAKTSAMSSITTALSRINEIYRRDLAIQFELVKNNDKLIYTDGKTDPFYDSTEINAATQPSSNTAVNPTKENDNIEKNQRIVDKAIGSGNYDLAHLFTLDGGGLAVNGLCDTANKAQATSGQGAQNNDTFYISYVAHEIGHQLGANHTFNGMQGACDASNRFSSTAWEVGSGSTIMSYAGICPALSRTKLMGDNTASQSDAFFHIGSIEEILSFTKLANVRATTQNKTCGKLSTLKNTAPSVDAGGNTTIPAHTPFFLTGTATDTENDTLSYSWEQIDTGAPARLNANGTSKDNGSGPLFRSLEPTRSASRFLPSFSGVVSGNIARGENYPSTDRTLNFRLTVRDGKGGVSTDAKTVTVKNTGRAFKVIQPSAATLWPQGGKGRVVWDSAGTSVSPINCSKVDIMYFDDAGEFTTLLEDTANTGAAMVSVPQNKTDSARIMVMCRANGFYAVNPAAFGIVDSADATPLDQTPVPPAGIGAPANQNPPAPSSGGGSGGGSIPPLFVVLLLSAALLSIGCKHLEKQHIQADDIATGKNNPAQNQANIEDTAQVDIDLSHSPKDAVTAAIARDDFNLYILTSRRPVIPGIPPAETQAAHDRCGVKYVSATGDFIKNQAQRDQRKQLVSYATQYNVLMYDYCKKGMMRP